VAVEFGFAEKVEVPGIELSFCVELQALVWAVAVLLLASSSGGLFDARAEVTVDLFDEALGGGCANSKSISTSSA